MEDNTLKIMEIDINEILPNRFQPRIRFDEDEILELSDSIREHGVIQPILVRQIGDKYEIISGERRYKASVLAGKDTVPVIVKNLDDRECADLALTENVQRKNLTPIEEAISYKKRLDMGNITQEELALKLGKSQSDVNDKIRLLNLSDEVQDALLTSKISERHARSLLRLDTQKSQNEMLHRIINERLTVKRTDEEIDKLKELEITKEERGEIEMNNNENFNTVMPQTVPVQNFDIFSGDTATPVAPMPAPVAPVEVPVPGAMKLDANGVVPQTPAVPSAPSGIQFDANGFVVAAGQAPQVVPSPVAPVEVSVPGAMNLDTNGVVPQVMPAPVAPVEVPVPGAMKLDANGGVPQTPAVPSAPAGIQFDANGFVVAADQVPQAAPMPAPVEAPTVEENFDDVPPVGPGLPGYTVPELSPIMEAPVAPMPTPVAPAPVAPAGIQFDANGFVVAANQAPAVPSAPAPTTVAAPVQEPIIITDYSKQYDPVMPQKEEYVAQKVDLKQIIEMIRNCSSNIEASGYKVELEEYNLQDMYQVIFKIQK